MEKIISQAYTFDDLLIRPGYSDFERGDIKLSAKLTKNITKKVAFLDSGSVSIYYKKDNVMKNFYIEEPNYYIQNYSSVDEISRLNKFFLIIEKYYKIKFSTN